MTHLLEHSAARGPSSIESRKTVVIISPVRNEIGHFERVAKAVAGQTRPPDLWLVADDGSDDGTRELALRLEREISFMRVVAIESSAERHPDRLALALEARAFNKALEKAGDYTHVGKLDGDIELPAEYFQRALREFDRRPRLGITGGSIVEPTGRSGAWVRVTAPDRHVHGGVRPDGIAELDANERGDDRE